jgi:apolipoprotein N-acyltransferase
LILKDFSNTLAQLSHRKALILAFVAGGLATLTLPPVSCWPLLFPAFYLLYHLIEEQPVKVAFWRGWSFGFGYFTTGLYWIAFALQVEIERFFWLIPFAVVGLPTLLALYIGIFAGIFGRLVLSPVAKWLAFATLWSVFEWLRGHLFTGFPWNLIAYSWMAVPAVLQLASVVGAYGLSFLTVLFATLPVLDVQRQRKLLITVGILFGGLWGFGEYRLSHTETQFFKTIHLRLVQPCIPQKLKWDSNMREQHFALYLRLSRLPSARPITHIIWPEAAVPFFIEHDPLHRQQIAAIAPLQGSVILGTVRLEHQFDQPPILRSGMVAINARGDIEGAYNKSHLVPFGEYVPFRWLFPRMVKKVTAGAIDFTPGNGLQTLEIPGLPPVSPLVCYEGIFPGEVVRSEGIKAHWLLNLTNDAWYGRTAGPYQHLAITQLRAIEQGLPLVRVANNGISAVVDPCGRIVKSLPLDQQGVLDIGLPKPLSILPLYARYGNVIFWLLIGLTTLIVIIIGRLRGIKKSFLLPRPATR